MFINISKRLFYKKLKAKKTRKLSKYSQNKKFTIDKARFTSFHLKKFLFGKYYPFFMVFFQDFEFYWLREGVIAGSSRPYSQNHVQFIAKQGIKKIISIVDPALIQGYASNFGIDIIPFEFVDFGVPSLYQVQEFFSILDDCEKRNTPILVHCAMGCGRTGLLLTLYLMKYEKLDLETDLTD